MGFTGMALTSSLIMIESLTVLLLPALDIPGGGLVGIGNYNIAVGGVGRTRSEAIGENID